MAVLIANLDNRTGDAVFDGALEQMFQLGVEGTSFITAYPRQSAQRLATEIAPGSTLDEERARLVAIREGVKVVLAGRIRVRWRWLSNLDARHRPDARRTPGLDRRARRQQERRPEDGGEVVAEVRATLGDTATRDTMLASAETFTATSLEAVRAHLAQDLAVGGKHEEAVVKHQEAIDRDADFGRAYSGLALSLSFLGRPNEAESQWKNALSRLERMTERENLPTLGLHYNSVTRNYEKAIESFSTLVTLYPADAAGHSNLALAYFRNLNFQKALEEGGLAVKIYPGSVATWNNYVLYAMLRRRLRHRLCGGCASSRSTPISTRPTSHR